MNAIRSHARTAFTLIEVLAAITVMAIVLPACMYGITLSSKLASQTRDRTLATTFAEEKLNEVVGLAEWSTGPTSGDFADEGEPGFRWTASVTTWTDPTLTTATFNQIDMTVTWEARGQQQQIVLSTVVYTPATSSSTGLGTGL